MQAIEDGDPLTALAVIDAAFADGRALPANRLRILRGVALHQQGSSAAEAAFIDALGDALDEVAACWKNLAVLLNCPGRRDEALEFVIQYRNRLPHESEAALIHARILADDGALPAAMEVVDEVLGIYPDDIEAREQRIDLLDRGHADLAALFDLATLCRGAGPNDELDSQLDARLVLLGLPGSADQANTPASAALVRRSRELRDSAASHRDARPDALPTNAQPAAATPGGQFRVGLVWADTPRRPGGPLLNDLRSLLVVPGIEWIALQTGDAAAEAGYLPGHPLGVAMRAAVDDREALAALTATLDLVIGVDALPTHLAAALGRPTWLLLPYDADAGDWQDQAARSPGVPRIFRQAKPGDWVTLAQELRSGLFDWCQQRGGGTYPACWRVAREWLSAAAPDSDAVGAWLVDLPPQELGRAAAIVSVLAVRRRNTDLLDRFDVRCGDDPEVQATLLPARFLVEGWNQRTAADWNHVRSSGHAGTPVWLACARAVRAGLGPLAGLEILQPAVTACAPDPYLYLELGRSHALAGQAEAAAASFGKALELLPQLAEAWQQLAQCDLDSGAFEAAVGKLGRALAIDPAHLSSWRCIAEIAKHRDLPDLACRVLASLRTHHDDAGLRYQLAENLARAGRDDEALQLLGEPDPESLGESDWPLLSTYRALEHWREHDACMLAMARRGLVEQRKNFEIGCRLLQRGDAAEGWRFYANGLLSWRLTTSLPRWDGSGPAGRSILVFQDQGSGDLIQFLPMVPMLSARGARVTLAVEAGMVGLISQQRLDAEVVALDAVNGSDGPWEFQVAQMLLPGIFGIDLERPPHAGRILRAPPLYRPWAERLGAERRLKVGIRWAGNPNFRDEALRGSRLGDWRILAALDGIAWINLQKDVASNQALGVPEFDLANPMADCRDWADTAAVIAALDLVISTDTGVAHLAAALGVETWILLPPIVGDFRWLLDRDDVPWYPSARLFRRRRGESVAELMLRVFDALRRRLATRR